MIRKKILVVDDDQVIVTSLSMKLKAEGFEVVVAAEPSEAVAVARKETPDIIILDINFPPDVASGGLVPWDGFRIMDWLQRVIEGRKIPVIILTGTDSMQARNRALAAGAQGFFTKPVESELLLRVIRRVLDEVKPEPAPAR
jgi:two-component system cell cycle response regulator